MRRILAALAAVAVMAALVPQVPVPAHAAGTVTVEICVPALDADTITCGQPVPQGAPWVLYRVHGLTPGARIDIVSWCRWVGEAYSVYWCFSSGVARGDGFPPGTQTVVVRDTATGTEIARTEYTVVPQTPEQALAAFRGGHSTWARAAVVLALARLGQLDQALAAAQAMRRDSVPRTQYEGLLIGTNVLLAEGRPAEAEQWAQAVIVFRRAHGEPEQALDYVDIARAALAACDVTTAERALGQASLRAPEWPEVERELVRVEAAKSTCARPGANSENP